MDFNNHPLSRQSTVNNQPKLKQSTIDYQVSKYRTLLKDPNLGAGLVAEALMKLSESEVDHIADYASRKGTHPGKVFVRICNNAMREKGVK